MDVAKRRTHEIKDLAKRIIASNSGGIRYSKLVLFDLDPKSPNFSIRVRAQRFSPDMFYVNEFADRLRQLDSETFETLFR